MLVNAPGGPGFIVTFILLMKNRLLLSAAFLASAGVGKATAQTAPWKFAVLSDTQWVQAGGATAPIDDGKSPASFPASMIQQIDQEFLRQGVKLVIAVGDTIDGNKQVEIQARSLYSQDLYNAGVGFFPVRGNHEAGGNDTGMYFASYFPQTVNGGVNNQTPNTYNVSTIVANWPSSENLYDTQATLQSTLTSTFPPPAKTNQTAFTIGSNFSYPAANGTGNQLGQTPGDGLSYSFDYNNVRFVLVDQFVNGSTNNSTLTAQQDWLTSRLSDPARPLQAFVFAHKNLLGGSHKDNLFGNQTASTDPGDGTGSTGTAQTARQQAFDNFVTSLANNNVRLYVGGHDHHHKRSLVNSPLNPAKFVQQVISQSDSNKFYTPSTPFSVNETSIEEDLYEIGVYVYTVDGPRLTAEYFAVPANLPNPTGNDAFPATPVLTGNWTRQTTFGYSLNGKGFLVPEGATYTTVADSTANAISNASTYGESGFVGTNFQIVNGTNGSTKKTNDGRVLTKYVNTGFAPKAANTVSDIVSVWGLADLSSLSTDTVKVAVSFNPATVINSGSVVLGVRDPKTGNWINAVDYNVTGSNKLRVDGNYQNAPNTLGTYGVDLTNSVAYAVVNGNAREFAVIPMPSATLPWDFNGDGRVTSTDANTVNTAARTKSSDLRYDLNNDGRVDAADVRWLTQHYTGPNGQ